MRICSRPAIAFLTLALSCSPLLAQGDPKNPPPEQPGSQEGFMSRGAMGPGEMQGRWGRRRGGFDRGDGMGRREFGLARVLNNPDIRQQVGITEEQATAIRKQETDFRKTEIRDRADLAVKRIDLKDLLAVDKPDRAAINAKLQEISTAQLALEKSAINYRLNMREAITPAQREKLRQLMSDRWRQSGRDRMGRRGAERGGRRGPAPAPNPPSQPQPNE